ncbi:unnamed protein product [Bemisia tabaci]|uniref:Ketosynthase family 3 (KS3) domain-containing protein n=1 Tax=Bemisia tabaci TaxID=7038 RepID=A0A9P0F822_BEMTA|nr:unnamed protein product [Bemisia tabaci]
MKERVEVVISGAAGTFPQCKSIPDLEDALFKKAHLITTDDSKQRKNHGAARHCGKAFSPEKFDAIFFKVPFSSPPTMDPIAKQALETSIEAIIDAGVNPKSLAGSKTAVFSVYDFSEFEMSTPYAQTQRALLGVARCFTANRLSFTLDLKGPSFSGLGGYGQTFHFINEARAQLEEGLIDAALVVTANFILSPRSVIVAQGMGLAAEDGKCNAFDQSAHGYALSESCVAFFIQRAPDARRNWATIIGAEHRFFGTKEGNLLAFDGGPVKEMLRQLYSKWNVDPSDVGYIEADGCGLKDIDAKEADIISDVFCRKRKQPLLIGSVKSNMGHAESAACAAGAVKAIIALTSSTIPPNINITSPIPELAPKRIKVVTEATELNGGLIGVNSIGLTGHFGHLLLKANPKKSSTMQINESLPQIILLSSRTESGIEDVMKRVRSIKVTPEFASLVNGVFGQEVQSHNYRGYAIVPTDSTNVTIKSQRIDDSKRPIWWVFSGMGSQWSAMGAHLMHIPIFRDVIDRCDKVLAPRGVDIKHILTSSDKDIFNNILHAFVGITATQLGLVEILRALNMEPEGIVGHSVGELGCAYADNCLTLEQTILSSYARGKASLESTLIEGMMAAVGLSYSKIVSQLPETIDVACRNSDESCTISGPAADVEKFVADLTSKGVFARTVNAANIAYHSRYIQPAAPTLLKYLREVIPEKTARSAKWISSSVPQENWDSDLAIYSSAEYHTNNLLSPVLFEESIKFIPSDAVIIEVAPHGLLQAILKRAMPNKCTNIPLAHRSSPDGVKFLLEAIGQLYLLGYEPNVSALYPPVQYPVPCDTPSLQPFTTWDHTETYCLPNYVKDKYDPSSLAVSEKSFTLKEIKCILKSYKQKDLPISLIPFFMIEVWKTFGDVMEVEFKQLPVMFENIQIYSELDLSAEGLGQVRIQLMRGSGEFIVLQAPRDDTESDFVIEEQKPAEENQEIVLMAGKIKIWESPKSEQDVKESPSHKIKRAVNGEKSDKCFSDSLEMVDELSKRGVIDWQVSSKGATGIIEVNSDLVIYLDTIMKLNTIWNAHVNGKAAKPVSIQYMYLNYEQVANLKEDSTVDLCLDKSVGCFNSAGITINGFKTEPLPEKSEKLGNAFAERLNFVPYGKTTFKDLRDFTRASLQIIAESSCHRPNGLKRSIELKVFEENGNTTSRSLAAVFTNFLRTSDDLNVEFVPYLSCAKNSSSFGTSLLCISDLKTMSRIPMEESCDNVHVIVAVPVKIQMKDIFDSASKCEQNYAVIYEQAFGPLRYVLLKKKIFGQKLKVRHVSNRVISSSYDLGLERNFEDECSVLVFTKSQSGNPAILMRNILKKAGKRKLKFFFLLDDDAPSFSLTEKVYQEQLDRDVAVNVLKSGRWGSFLGTPLQKPAQKDVAQILSNVGHVSKEVDIRYVGLNPGSYRPKEAPAVLDYSGVTSTGCHVIGIAQKYEGFKSKMSLDPVFQWAVPDSLPLDEAAALPSAYLMAHAILDQILIVPTKKTALIMNGQTPVGMACISLCLAMDYNIYTTVPNEAALKTVSRTFPQIPLSNITNHNSEDFYVPLMFGTGGTGADIIVSDLPRRQMLSAWKCIGKYGCFINLNEETMYHNAPLPMGRFNDSNGYYSFELSRILRLPEERKVKLHAKVSASILARRAVRMPYQSMDLSDLSLLPSYVEMVTEQGGKLLLDVGRSYTANTIRTPILNDRCAEQDEWIADTKFQTSVVILGSSAGKVVSLVEWLLEREVKNIVLSILDANDKKEAVRKIHESTSKHDATLLMTSAKVAHTVAGLENILNQARRLGKITAVFTVSLDENDKILSGIQNIRKNLSEDYTLINIHKDTGSYEIENAVTIICDDELDCSPVLSQVLTDPNQTATYVISSRQSCGESDAALNVKEPMADYLPSSLRELEDMGHLLCQRDFKLGTQTSAKFMQTTSLAADMSDLKHSESLPVFFVPAFCETQLRPLISKCIYPCYVAHICPDIMSVENIADQLFESIKKIQSEGPYTIVSETWSGGVATLLANLLTNSCQAVSLFILQGVPKKMCSLLPLDESLEVCLIKSLFGLIQKERLDQSPDINGTKRIETALHLLPNEFNKTFVMRSLQTILRSLQFARSLSNCNICPESSLILIEVSKFCRLTTDDVEEISKNAQLVKIDCDNYKEMLSHVRTISLIAEEAQFSWGCKLLSQS